MIQLRLAWSFHNNRSMSTSDERSEGSTLFSFTAENARSYRGETRLSLLATRLSAEGVPRSLIPAGMTKPVRVLPAAGIFGANASGKTTILRAMADMRKLVINSFRRGSRGTRIFRRPFLLDSTCRDRPTRFEIDLLLEGVRWIYGFEVDDQRVREEYAYHWPRGRQALVFHRDGGPVAFGSRFKAEDRTIGGLLRDNALLLSVAGATGNEQLASLFEWFEGNMSLAESGNRDSRALFTAQMARTDDLGERMIRLLRAADLGVADLEMTRLEMEHFIGEVDERLQEGGEPLGEIVRILQHIQADVALPEASATSLRKLSLTHISADGGVAFSAEDESQGTLVWVSLIGPLMSALDNGNVVLIDELDASLHSHLVERIITMFQDPEINRRGAQLIFNSHDGAILQGRSDWRLGRDQIWFTEKYADGATKLYSLDDFSPRRDEDTHGHYFLGRYGAVPVVGDAAIRQALAPTNR